jgi:ankyrin repeat protein
VFAVAFAALLGSGCYLAFPVTPLAAAARAGDLKEIDRLAAAGANLDEGSGVNGWPPVIHAIHKGQTAALAHLLELGASISGRTGRTALLMASGYGSEPMVRVLLSRGADPRDDGVSGSRVLVEAVRGSADLDYHWTGCQPQTDVVRVLLTKDPALRLGAAGEAQSARARAQQRGCRELLKLVGE